MSSCTFNLLVGTSSIHSSVIFRMFKGENTMKANNNKKVVNFTNQKKANLKNQNSSIFGGNKQQNRAQFFKELKEKKAK